MNTYCGKRDAIFSRKQTRLVWIKTRGHYRHQIFSGVSNPLCNKQIGTRNLLKCRAFRSISFHLIVNALQLPT